jgi:hypothetical protein
LNGFAVPVPVPDEAGFAVLEVDVVDVGVAVNDGVVVVGSFDRRHQEWGDIRSGERRWRVDGLTPNTQTISPLCMVDVICNITHRHSGFFLRQRKGVVSMNDLMFASTPHSEISVTFEASCWRAGGLLG